LVNQPWQAGAYLVDLDGTLVSDGKPLPGAKRLLALMQDRFVLVSNDAEHTPAQLARLLAGIGLSIEARRILLAGAYARSDRA
jgi:NagD protein